MNRAVIVNGRKTLSKLYQVMGTDDVWNSVLAKYSDAQLSTAFGRILDGHTKREVRPADVAQEIRNGSFHGAGREHDGHILPESGWQFWKEARVVGRDKDGKPIEVMYEYAYHPSMPHYCKGRER